MSASQLLTLPRELRDKIYAELIKSLGPVEIDAEDLYRLFSYRYSPRYGQRTGLHKRPGPIAFLISHPQIFDEAWSIVLKNVTISISIELLRLYARGRGFTHFDTMKGHCQSLVLDAQKWFFASNMRNAIEIAGTFPKLERLEIRVDCALLPESLDIPRETCVLHCFPLLKAIKVRDVKLEQFLEELGKRRERAEAMVNPAAPWTSSWRLFEHKRLWKRVETKFELLSVSLPWSKLDMCDERLKLQVEARKFRRMHGAVCRCVHRYEAGLAGRIHRI